MIRKAKWKGYTALALGGRVGFFALWNGMSLAWRAAHDVFPTFDSRGFLLCLHSSPAFERSAYEQQSAAICGMGTNCRRCGAIGRVHQSLCPALTHGLSTFHRCRGRGSVIRAGSLGTWVRTGSRDLGIAREFAKSEPAQ
jgi:hypothetical protein